MERQVLGIYHKDCIDGTAAAAVLHKKFPEATLFPLSHSYTTEEMESIRSLASGEADVYTVDCVLGVRELLEDGCRVIAIDHHIGCRDWMEELAKENKSLTYIFDNDKSGASLAWAYFFPDEAVPELIQYVEDVDLWKWQYSETSKHVSNYLSIFRNDPETTLRLIEGDVIDVQEKGKSISEFLDVEIAKLTERNPISVRIGSHVVPAFNITMHQSASGNLLSQKLDTAVLMYTVDGPNVRLSFRSKEHHSPSSLELAHLFGGGGHKNASGAEVSLQNFLSMIVVEHI